MVKSISPRWSLPGPWCSCDTAASVTTVNVQAAVTGTPKPVETFLRKAGADFESKKAQQAGYKRDFNALIFGSLSMVPQKLALPSSTGLTRLLAY